MFISVVALSWEGDVQVQPGVPIPAGGAWQLETVHAERHLPREVLSLFYCFSLTEPTLDVSFEALSSLLVTAETVLSSSTLSRYLMLDAIK